ncbi:ATP-dependent DNA helicase PIF1, partial [Orchesella cincta]
RSLRDLLNCQHKPFGGVTVVVGGDFRQQAPVILHGNRVKTIESTVKSSKLWRGFKEISLTKNMRVNPDEMEFVEWLLRVGSGLDDEDKKTDFLKLPEEILSDNIIRTIFGTDINELHLNELASRASFAPPAYRKI